MAAAFLQHVVQAESYGFDHNGVYVLLIIGIVVTILAYAGGNRHERSFVR